MQTAINLHLEVLNRKKGNDYVLGAQCVLVTISGDFTHIQSTTHFSDSPCLRV